MYYTHILKQTFSPHCLYPGLLREHNQSLCQEFQMADLHSIQQVHPEDYLHYLQVSANHLYLFDWNLYNHLHHSISSKKLIPYKKLQVLYRYQISEKFNICQCLSEDCTNTNLVFCPSDEPGTWTHKRTKTLHHWPLNDMV